MPDQPTVGAALDVPGVEHLEEVARGGFAAVYRGWQPAFQRWVAVKVLTGLHGQSPAYRFDHELRALGSLSEHPHVVPVYEAGEAGGYAYLVMPYLTGGSLQQRLTEGRLDPSDAVATAQAVADALAEAHRLGILHRDIKPANILFTAYGVPQLADFGVARLSDTTLTGGQLAVTVAYAAPEILSGSPATARSDVYSVGATLYAALSGAPPFAGDGEGEGQALAQAVRVLQDTPPPLQTLGVAAPIAATVERAMAKDPGRRYGSAEELRDALAAVAPMAFGSDGPVASVRSAERTRGVGSAPAVETARRPGRRRVLALVAAAVVILAGAGTAIGISVEDQPAAGSHAAAPVTHPTATSSTSAPSPTAGTNPPGGTTAQSAPSAGAATSPAEVPPAVLADTLRSYYALVDQHQLDRTWQWLSPQFQQQIGRSYYQQFWDSISQVQVVSVTADAGAARIVLRYVTTGGVTSTEAADLGFVIGPGGTILIGTDQATG